MNVTVLLITVCDEGNDILLSDTFCESLVIVEGELLYLRHTLDVSIVFSFLKHLISECKFIHAFTVTTNNKRNREMLSASDYRIFSCCSKPFGFPFCDTCIYFFLNADRLIYWCDDTSFAYLEVEMCTALVVITFWVIKFTFPSGLISFALMFCAECWSHLHFADFEHSFFSCCHNILLIYVNTISVHSCQSLLFHKADKNPSESLTAKCAWCIRLHQRVIRSASRLVTAYFSQGSAPRYLFRYIWSIALGV